MLCHRHIHIHCHLFLLQLLVMPLLQGSPVSSPEIASKGSKSPNSLAQVQQQQQQQQQQEAHLNSLSAYASGYDMAQNQAQTQNQLQGQILSQTDPAFKPSYKMPEMETNFTPMQTAGTPSVASLPSTPMLMQYLPAQTIQDGSGNSVQYLQLIPTRPIIVPISPYLSAAAAAAGSPPAISAGAQPDFGGRTATVLSALPPNYAALQGYASGSINPAAAFRNTYRINREAKDKHFPPSFSLNLNEYLPAASMGLPGGHDASANGPHVYLRTRS
ncbi:mediator of RNA polymerase II transcription subunit 15 [Drosophila mauritiana]|uniref:Mediator of RNA polymerase II transcription subunit 15 n=1 Tax=Drosophila mauritiana TaxID=7226 RepID=A0A6P8KXP6_DROMA|nr:mediator of RNA polymerase II transcription subunit 15 [Drosophila mauritiana]